ncbi:MAG: hypothetical protein F6K50_27365 [Moorea sp. SIO3I7]|nr:hypothetical protein [Moorena sp. SIO3I7]NEO06005.1 hypothetical protein [Moorena sp. SIO3I8]
MRLYPTVELHKVWKQWLAAYRQVFNWALEQLKNGFNLKDDLQKAYRNSLAIPDWVRELPGHQAQEACDEAIDAYRQGKANGGEAKFKSCRSKSQTIQFNSNSPPVIALRQAREGNWTSNLLRILNISATTNILLRSIECRFKCKLKSLCWKLKSTKTLKK